MKAEERHVTSRRINLLCPTGKKILRVILQVIVYCLPFTVSCAP